MNNKMVDMVAFVLVVVGAINWGLVGLANMNVVSMVFGGTPMLEQIVYILVGLSGLYLLLTRKDWKM